MTLKGGKGNNATVKEVSLHKDKEKVIHDTNTNTNTTQQQQNINVLLSWSFHKNHSNFF